ncbi:hypothetical protein [Sporosarcina sp. BI001-red]|uniref:hypothetical protein n=1 Tax=Sporosarcina sp. BI001-red TaxID=2282866 RepID=UPI001313EB49|nr:hypothetical protein [Sporosarcina sp. BI001-red]
MSNITAQQAGHVRENVIILVEATEHLQSLVKVRDLSNSVRSFSVVVEGNQSIFEFKYL